MPVRFVRCLTPLHPTPHYCTGMYCSGIRSGCSLGRGGIHQRTSEHVRRPVYPVEQWHQCSYRYASFYENDPSGSKSFSRIITPEHASRIGNLLSETKGKVIAGGEVDPEHKYIAPTIVRDVPPDDSLMSEYVHILCPNRIMLMRFRYREVFGPVLSIIPVNNIDEAIAFANARYI